jgi:CRISPR-associated protein (TIGR03986 family)
MEKDGKDFNFLEKREREEAPCFFVDLKEPAFGHTPYFRLPYSTTTHKALHTKCEPPYPMAEAVFGTTNRRGRVFFEDAFVVESPPDAVGPAREAVLGAPKPTTFQHYLVQHSEHPEDSIHWDASGATVRGHKLYWHRPGAPLPEAAGKEGVRTRFKPAREGLGFRGRVRFENLRPEELGALLLALELPAGCAHRLGMAKPLGLGSFLISNVKVRTFDLDRRYGSLLARDGSTLHLEAGLKDASEEKAGWKNAFAAWFLKNDGAKENDLWSDARLAELKALLTFDGLPDRWLERTRYLEFGKVGATQYNEYTHVWYQEDRDRPRISKRRPLPRATQVLRGGPEIPADESQFDQSRPARPPDATPSRSGR